MYLVYLLKNTAHIFKRGNASYFLPVTQLLENLPGRCGFLLYHLWSEAHAIGRGAGSLTIAVKLPVLL